MRMENIDFIMLELPHISSLYTVDEVRSLMCNQMLTHPVTQ